MPIRPDDLVPYDYDTRLFEAPREALEHLKDELRQEYRATKTRESFIADARREHPHLREVDDAAINAEIDRLILHAGWGQVPQGMIGEFREEVAHQMRGAPRSSRSSSGSTGRHHLDGGDAGGSYRSGGIDENPDSLSSMIVERRRRREDAMTDEYHRRRGDRD